MTKLRRYTRAPILQFGKKFGTSFAIPAIRTNVQNGNIRFADLVTQENERLDILAGQFYGDGKLWWVIAAASEIGWALQVPPGTVLRIPNLDDCAKFVG